jgi:hypothetical membrane protein
LTEILKFGWYAIIVVVIGEMVVPMILSAFYKGYNQTTDAISALGSPNSPVRIPFNIWMFIAGTLLILSLPSIFTQYKNISGFLSVMLIVFIGIFAVGACIFSCFFSVNENKEVITTASKIHGIGSVTGFMLMLFVPLLIAVLSFKNNDRLVGIISIVLFLCAMSFFVLFIMADKPEFADTAIAKEGLWQRLSLLFMYLPLLIVAIKSTAISGWNT